MALQVESPTVIQTLLCEDVRIENTGKTILIGVFGAGVFVPSFPAHIMFVLWIRMLWPNAGKHSIELSAVNESNIMMLPVATFSLEVDRPSEYADVSVRQVLLTIQTAGDVIFKWRVAGDTEWKELITITVAEGSVPAATV
jgi:hypothetical protein